MEPFRLTLEQVTFEENDPAQQQLYVDSFDTVVNYDSSFQDSEGQDRSRSSPFDSKEFWPNNLLHYFSLSFCNIYTCIFVLVCYSIANIFFMLRVFLIPASAPCLV